MDNQDKIAHLGFIQGIINHMSNNSFLVKSWSVTLLAALFAALSMIIIYIFSFYH